MSSSQRAGSGVAAALSGDAFNYPMPGRADLMSLQTINAEKDQIKTTTNRFQSTRIESKAL